MKTDNKFNYLSPRLSMMTLRVEDGFAGSGEDGWYRNESNSTNIGWSYSTDDETWG